MPHPKKKSLQKPLTLHATLEKKRTEVGKLRDEIREILREYEALAESCDRAYEALEEVVDSLSELA